MKNDSFKTGLAKGLLINILLTVALLVLGYLNTSSYSAGANLFLLLFASIGVWQFIYLIPWALQKRKQGKTAHAKGIFLSALVGIVVTVLNFDIILLQQRIQLESLPQKITQYEDLPLVAQKAWKEAWREAIASNKFTGLFISTDNTIDVSNYYTSIGSGLWTFAKEGRAHHFLIDKKHYTLRETKPLPFLLHEGHFYYPQKLYAKNLFLEGVPFIEIQLNQ